MCACGRVEPEDGAGEQNLPPRTLIVMRIGPGDHVEELGDHMERLRDDVEGLGYNPLIRFIAALYPL
jgi:hypothetical protein